MKVGMNNLFREDEEIVLFALYLNCSFCILGLATVPARSGVAV
jgi:hypothetical protein